MNADERGSDGTEATSEGTREAEGVPLDYETPVPQTPPPGLRDLLRLRHDEPLTGRHVFVVLLALGLFLAVLWVMESLFPGGG